MGSAFYYSYNPSQSSRRNSALTQFKIDTAAFKSATWIHVQHNQNIRFYEKLPTVLDQGEAEAIVLATEINESLLLIDEKKGREQASWGYLMLVKSEFY